MIARIRAETAPGPEIATPSATPASGWVEHWPSSAEPIGNAVFKAEVSDFKVIEQPLPAAQMRRTDVPVHDAAQRLLSIRKTGVNTVYVAGLLARWAEVADVEVGYAGRKDRHAVTEQWFSVPAHAVPDTVADFTKYAAGQLQAGEALEVIAEAWQPRKLRIGELAGNRFEIILRELSFNPGGAPLEQLRNALQTLAAQGVPNYFGPQRFGHGNLEQALQWLGAQTDPARRRKAVRKRGGRSNARRGLQDGAWQRSTLRSYLFNAVLAARVADGTFSDIIAGDVQDEQGRAATAPLWGRGRSAASADALAVEERALAPYADLCGGLEHTGLTQQRRALCVWPADLDWELRDGQLRLQFGLPAGSYASVLLAQVFKLTDAAARTALEARS